MNRLLICLTVVLIAATAHAAPPSFRDTATPEGWTIVSGETGTGLVLQAKNAGALQVKTIAPVVLPVEATFRFRAAVGDDLNFEVTEGDTNLVSPLLSAGFQLNGPNSAQVRARGSNALPLAGYINYGGWRYMGGRLPYGWRFPQVKNLWDERDRLEIGADYETLAPFTKKIFTLRLVLTGVTRQIWLDDRLMGEERGASPAQVRFSIKLAKTAQVLAADFRSPEETGSFYPLSLTAYSHARNAQETNPVCELARLPGQVPMWVPKTPQSDIDLGRSLFRYRLTHGSGPNAGYVDAWRTWPSTFEVDPASLTFRVPYRHYQNVWLLAWLDDRPDAVPSGTLRFFREQAGYPANTEFEITEAAIKKGLVTKLPRRTPEGKSLYLVKVPVDTDGLFGLSDDAYPFDIGVPRGSRPFMEDQLLDFELTKPVSLMRGYPDPIYYGSHPSGKSSSVRVVGITLEEASFGYEVRPTQVGHVFERPQKPAYDIVVTNTTNRRMTARVKLQTRSFDSAEKGGARSRVTIPARGTSTVKLDFDLKKLGWHELRVEVEANNQKRANTLALVVLPPNTRTYGYAPNEIRFGTWQLTGLYAPMEDGDEKAEALLAMYRKLGIRRVGGPTDKLKRHDLIPTGPHTVGTNFWPDAILPDGTVNPEGMAKGVAKELAEVAKVADFPESVYFYGAEWGISKEVSYAPWPRYTGDGDRELTAEEQAAVDVHVKIFTAIGRAIRAKYPKTKLVLQWGAPFNTIAYLRAGMPRDLVDLYGLDQPQFELLPEISNIHISINQLWALRQETKLMGWPRLPMNWCEGPFFPTNPGALTEAQQAEHQVRYWLLALAYGVEQFDAGVVMHDAGGYYGAEHYGAGIFHRKPLEHPKPAVAAVATATAMLCGADVVGPLDTGSLTDYCLAFQRAPEKTKIYALWRVNGAVEATLKVRGGAQPVITDAMGNATPCPVKNGAITVKLSSSPVWLTGVEGIDGFAFAPPQYSEVPARVTRPLAAMNADQWIYDGAEDEVYASNHFAIRRIPNPNLKAEFGQGEEGYADAVAITLPVEPGDRPMANRYGQLKLRKPVVIPGKASALGIWIKGNSSWGRVVYQLRDAKGETWTSVGTKDDWNCDDIHAWSYVSFEGWRYVRFPLPGNYPYDAARELESTWWGSRDGDGIVDLPLTLEKIIVEARNEVPYLGEMKLVPDRSYKLAGLVAEYDTEENTTDKPVAENKIRMLLPEWKGPDENLIAKLNAEGVGAAPTIKAFAEPLHFNDGRSMLIRFDQDPALTYNLYLGRYPDGHGAELLAGGVKDNQSVSGLRPETTMYLFLTAVSVDGKESKPSAAFELITQDNFAEK